VGEEEADIDAVLARATVLACGPGLGTGPGASRLLTDLLDAASVPMVLDADALNLLALDIAPHGLPEPREERPLVLTPHPGEFARLAKAFGQDVAKGTTQHQRLPAAQAIAEKLQC